MEQEVGTLSPQASAQIVSGWARIRGRLREEVGDSAYKSWMRQMTLQGVEGDEVIITLPTRFMRDWVSSQYGDRLRTLWQAECPSVRRVDIRVSQGGPAAADAEVGAPDDAAVPPGSQAADKGLAESLAPRPAAEPRAAVAAADPRSDWV